MFDYYRIMPNKKFVCFFTVTAHMKYNTTDYDYFNMLRHSQKNCRNNDKGGTKFVQANSASAGKRQLSQRTR